jgi:ribosomal protein L20A (L18A)
VASELYEKMLSTYKASRRQISEIPEIIEEEDDEEKEDAFF